MIYTKKASVEKGSSILPGKLVVNQDKEVEEEFQSLMMKWGLLESLMMKGGLLV